MAQVDFNAEETPLTRLATRRGAGGEPFLSTAEAMAGEKIRVDFTRGQMAPAIGQRWDGMPRAPRRGALAHELSDTAIDARRRVAQACDAIGPELSGLVLDVCCFLKGLETVEKERRWPARSAKLLLKTGLAMLARHYGFDGAVSSQKERRMRHWRAPDTAKA
ncbi:DUF6456 domain-containing protein [Jiella sp. MQZ9-1]|uniref:DNA replication protein n=1 Tax=Jiella flava TaxID=2816857 RepID=A0A939JVF5_9HYPH|nr:DUF6456 domain-containing protein [Jiella flava]MBO0662404.1 DNA replication protein [Jiella flava]MCD2471628.1 DUF6456 domain-containing protein [Jiella flava]